MYIQSMSQRGQININIKYVVFLPYIKYVVKYIIYVVKYVVFLPCVPF